MKRTLFVILLITIGCLMVACARNKQTHDISSNKKVEHFTFVNTPIDGDCGEFAQILKGKGFVLDKQINNRYAMHGSYMGKHNSKITLFPTDNINSEHGDTIYKVKVSFPNDYNGSKQEVFNHYVDIKDLLTSEFGSPNDKEHYVCYTPDEYINLFEFESAEGYVKLGLKKDDAIDLIYIDKLNATLKDKSEKTCITTMHHHISIPNGSTLLYQS